MGKSWSPRLPVHFSNLLLSLPLKLGSQVRFLIEHVLDAEQVLLSSRGEAWLGGGWEEGLQDLGSSGLQCWCTWGCRRSGVGLEMLDF